MTINTCYWRLGKLFLWIIFLIRLSCPQSVLTMLNVKSKSTPGRRDTGYDYVIHISLLCFSVFYKYFNSNFIFLSYENKLNNFKCYWIMTTGSIPDIQNALIPKYSEIAWGRWPPNSHGDYSFFLLPLASVNWLLPTISILSQDSPIY